MGQQTATVVDALLGGYFERYPAEVAGELENLSGEDAARLLEKESMEQATAVFERLTTPTGAEVLRKMGRRAAARILKAADPGIAAARLARMDPEEQENLLKLLPGAAAKELRTLMQYPEETAGSLMDPRVSSFRQETTAAAVLSRLRKNEGRVYDVYVVDEEGRLVAAVPLENVAVADPKQRLEEIPRGAAAFVQVTASREEIVETLEGQKLTNLPVVDFEGRLLGVIRYDALVMAAQEEATLDIQTMVGASKDERALSPVPFAVRKRLPWLVINLGTAFLAAAVVGMFEGMIAKVTALAVLLPVVAGQSGNTGAQALAVTMRGLALREVRVRQWLRLLVKETSVGMVNGVAIAVITSFFVFVWSHSAGLAIVIGSAMVLSMIAAGIAGTAIPVLLTAVGQDPAQSSSIVLTTITDVTGFFSFLGIATLLWKLL